MIIKVRRIVVIPFSLMLCSLHALLGIFFGVIITIGSLTTGEDQGFWSLGPWALVVIPFLNAIFGFLMGLLITGCYNFLSGWMGKVELEVEEA